MCLLFKNCQQFNIFSRLNYINFHLMKIIIISGPSGSGKTSLAKKLMAELDNCYILSTDDFYKTGIISNILSYFIKSYFDKRISHNSKLLRKTINKILKNKEINYSYNYNFIKKRTEIIYKRYSCIQHLIIEGIFTLELLKFISFDDLILIRLNISREICKKRIYERDHIERGKSTSKSIKDFKEAWNIYQNKEKSYKTNGKNKELIFKNEPNINLILKKII